jgi:hypothetical protein
MLVSGGDSERGRRQDGDGRTEKEATLRLIKLFLSALLWRCGYVHKDNDSELDETELADRSV